MKTSETSKPETRDTSRFLLVAVGSVGDVYPYLGIGHRLGARGHQVSVIASPYYETQVRELGLAFIPLGTLAQQQELLSHPDAWHPRKGWRVWMELGALDRMRQLYEIVAREYTRGETVVAGSWGSIGARVAQEKLGIPMATLHLEPGKFRSAYESAEFPRGALMWHWFPPWLKRFGFWLADAMVIDRVLSPITRFRQQLDLPHERHFMWKWIHSPQVSIGLFPDWWYTPQPDWPPQAELCGFPLWDQSPDASLPPEVADFIGAEKPVVFTPGAVNLQARDFFRVSSAVCAERDIKAIFLTKYPELLPEHLPPRVKHFDYVPFRPLLPDSSLVVHHAGIGTTAQCLAAGIPQVVMPTMHFHDDTAIRLERLGVGRSLPPENFQHAELSAAIADMLRSTDVQSRCGELAALSTEVDAVDLICDRLEGLVGTDL